MSENIHSISQARLNEIILGSAPVENERFCIGFLLTQKSLTERIEMALKTKLSWRKFSRRFEALTGVDRDRVHNPGWHYARQHMVEYQKPHRI